MSSTLPWEDPLTKDSYDPTYVDVYTNSIQPEFAKALEEQREKIEKITDPLLQSRAKADISVEIINKYGYLPYDSFESEIIVSDETFPSIDGTQIPIRVYKPKDVKPNNAVFIHFHGGGFVLGDLEFDKGQNYWLVHLSGVTVIDVHYRLIPEWTYSTSFYDSYGVIKYVYEHPEIYGIDPNKVSIGGTSAGGKISLASAHVARDLQIPLKLVFANVPPVEDLRNVTKAQDARYSGSLVKFANDPVVNFDMIKHLDEVREIAETTASKIDEETLLKNFPSVDLKDLDTYESSILDSKNFKGLTKHVIYVGEHDGLRDGGKAYAKKLIDENIEVTFRLAKGLGHQHSNYPKVVKESKKFLLLLANELKRLQAGEL